MSVSFQGDVEEVEAWYSRGAELGLEVIRIGWGPIGERTTIDLDIKDAVFLQWQLAGAIDDYAKAVGK